MLTNKISTFLWLLCGQGTSYKEQISVTRDEKTLYLCYCVIPRGFYCKGTAPLGDSERNMVLLIPSYHQRLRAAKPYRRTVKQWFPQAMERFKTKSALYRLTTDAFYFTILLREHEVRSLLKRQYGRKTTGLDLPV